MLSRSADQEARLTSSLSLGRCSISSVVSEAPWVAILNGATCSPTPSPSLYRTASVPFLHFGHMTFNHTRGALNAIEPYAWESVGHMISTIRVSLGERTVYDIDRTSAGQTRWGSLRLAPMNIVGTHPKNTYVTQGVVTSVPRVHSVATGIKNLDRQNSALIS